MNPLSAYTSITVQPTLYRDERDQLIQEAVIDINLLRMNTKWEKRKETARSLAIRCNSNPFLQSTQELRYVIDGCQKRRNYSHLYSLLPR